MDKINEFAYYELIGSWEKIMTKREVKYSP